MDYSFEAAEQYNYARKLARKNYRECLKNRKEPNLLALEDIVNPEILQSESLGTFDIPSFLIIGTKTSSRANSFSANFLPLVKTGSEFCLKWKKVCEYHLSDTGICDPPEVLEYLGKFYVTEGNKRISVLKSYGSPLITCNVTRLLPVQSGDEQIKLYNEFLEFYKLSRLYSIQFTKLGYYTTFQRALGFDENHVWTRNERINIVGFEDRLIRLLKHHNITTSHADCLAAMLEMYTFDYLFAMPDKQIDEFIEQNKTRLLFGKGFYKIECVGDTENNFFYTADGKKKLSSSDFLISVGDLNPRYLEYLVTVANKPLFYICGNHDNNYIDNPPEGCICIDDDIYEYQGIRILGLGGSLNYNNGPFQYSEKEMKKRIRKLKRKIHKFKGVDIIVSHAPIKGYGDLEDLPHQGFECFKELLADLKPKYWIYGHVHSEYSYNVPRIQSANETMIVNVSGNYEIRY